MKKINVVRLVLVLIAVVALHFATGLFLSPLASRAAAGLLARHSKAKITFDRLQVWPLTLSVEVKGLKVFDPEDASKRIAAIDDARIGFSLLGILSKQAVVSEIVVRGADVDIEGASDGTYNIEKLIQPEGSAVKAERTDTSKKDWFGSIRTLLEKNFSKSAREKEKEKRARENTITKSVSNTHHGRRVEFKRPRGAYLLEIKKIDVRKAHIHFVYAGGPSVDIDNVSILLGGIGIGAENGVDLGSARFAGALRQAGLSAASLDARFNKNISGDELVVRFALDVKDVDLRAIRFIYEESAPVIVQKGILSLISDTEINGGLLRSKNSLSLRDHELIGKADIDSKAGFLPLSMICETLNTIKPLQLNFNIGGSIEKPEFSGLQESLRAIVTPHIKNVGEQLKREGLNFLNDFLKKYEKNEDPGK